MESNLNVNVNSTVKNELDKPIKKNIFIRMIEEIKSIFAKEPDENISNSSSFVNAPENDKKPFSLFSKKKNVNILNKDTHEENITGNTLESKIQNSNLNYIQKPGTSVNKNINIDLSQNANETEIVKKRAKHLVEDSLNERLELEDLSYYDLKILFNGLKKQS